MDESIGGLSGAIARSEANLAVIRKFVNDTPWLNFLAQDWRQSPTRACLSLVEQVKEIAKLLGVSLLRST